MDDLYALIMAGGRGTRFWPLSRRALPKQCLSIGEGPTLLQRTVRRLQPLIPPERVLVMTGPDMADTVRAQLDGVPQDNVLVEPSARNTAPCVGWGAVEVARRGGGNAVMAVLPADHRITDPEALRGVLSGAVEAARVTNALITLGVRPTQPETGFGYLEVGPEMGRWGGHQFRMVERFIEKPDLEKATSYVASGRHLWNAGMFVFTVDAIRDAFRNHLPASAEVLEEVRRNPARLVPLWERMDATSLDYGIMERSRHILTVPCEIGWCDVGTWSSAARYLDASEGGRAATRYVIAIDAERCVVHARGKIVALVGVRDLVVVDTPDALLVMHVERSADLRQVVQRLEQRGEDDCT